MASERDGAASGWDSRYRGDAVAELPERLNLRELRRAASGCTACPLHAGATQTVFGEGLVRSRLMLVGEQPGDREDREGKPFVGPAGRLLGELLERAGIDRDEAYVTNAVKHFKWKRQRGKRRIHDTPSAGEINACLPWWRAEVEVVEPEVVLCLGATAAKAVLGPKARVTRDRGAFFEPDEAGLPDDGPLLTMTLHPSAVLRIDEREDRKAEEERIVAELSAVADHLGD